MPSSSPSSSPRPESATKAVSTSDASSQYKDDALSSATSRTSTTSASSTSKDHLQWTSTNVQSKEGDSNNNNLLISNSLLGPGDKDKTDKKDTVLTKISSTDGTLSKGKKGDAEEITDFTRKFSSIMSSYHPFSTSWEESSEHLRRMLRTGPLSIFDLTKRPHLFFLAHRLLADSLCAGFGIRYTVLFNLFAGSIIGLGTEQQALDMLVEVQKKGQLGCFALTEKSAGVLSGLIVETTAKWCVVKKCFILNTPNVGATKNWISQGLAAEFVVVIATLIDGLGENHGPHAFVVRLRSDRVDANDSSDKSKTKGPCPSKGYQSLCKGITCIDMGKKTVANDLDSASLSFDQVEVPLSGLLQRYCTIDETEQGQGRYVQKEGKEKMRIEVIGQRLLTGRLAIAEMAVEGVKKILNKVEDYAKNKLVHVGPDIDYPLAEVPQLAHILRSSSIQLTQMERYSREIEKSLCGFLRENSVPPPLLVEEIAVAKIKALEVSIGVLHKVEQEVGSFALMMGSGFEHKDVLLCCKFAEGDSRILQQKMVRDTLKWASKLGIKDIGDALLFGGSLFGGTGKGQQDIRFWNIGRPVVWSALKLGRRLQVSVAAEQKKNKDSHDSSSNFRPISDAEKKTLTMKARVKAWNDAFQDVYGLADLICEQRIRDRIGRTIGQEEGIDIGEEGSGLGQEEEETTSTVMIRWFGCLVTVLSCYWVLWYVLNVDDHKELQKCSSSLR